MDHFYNREMRKIFEIFLIKKIISPFDIVQFYEKCYNKQIRISFNVNVNVF